MKRNAAYWKVLNGQLGNDDLVDMGSREKYKADNAAEELTSLGYNVEVIELGTLEHDLPSDHPFFFSNQAFESSRWCPVIKS